MADAAGDCQEGVGRFVVLLSLFCVGKGGPGWWDTMVGSMVHPNLQPPPPQSPTYIHTQTPDPSGSGQCLTPGGIAEAAPIICPQYAGDGCCTWQQNYVLWRNLHTLVKTCVVVLVVCMCDG